MINSEIAARGCFAAPARHTAGATAQEPHKVPGVPPLEPEIDFPRHPEPEIDPSQRPEPEIPQPTDPAIPPGPSGPEIEPNPGAPEIEPPEHL